MLLELKTFKSYLGRGSTNSQWTNRYYFETDSDPTPEILQAIVDKTVAFERAFHLTTTQFMRAVIRQVGVDNETLLNPIMRVINLTGAGTNDANSSQAEPLQVCLHARFNTENGRSGGNWYRGALGEFHVGPGGDGGPTLNAGVGGFDAAATIMATPTNGFNLVLVKHPKSPQRVVRVVQSITVGDAAMRQRTVYRRKKLPPTPEGVSQGLDESRSFLGDVMSTVLDPDFLIKAATLVPGLSTKVKAILKIAGTVNDIFDPPALPPPSP